MALMRLWSRLMIFTLYNKMEEFKSSPGRSASSVLGEMVWLYSMSDLHRTWAIASIHLWLLPALETKQFRLYHQGEKPVGLVTWAWMSREVEQAYLQKTDSLKSTGWTSGDRLWAIDFIAPFGDARRIVKDLRNSVFSNLAGKSLSTRHNSDAMRVLKLHGANVLKTSREKI